MLSGSAEAAPAPGELAQAAPELPPDLQQLAGEAERLDAPAPAPDKMSGPAEPAPTIKTAELLEGLLLPLAEILPHLHHGFSVKPVKAHEVKMLAAGWAGVLDHYFPGGVGTWGPWGAALLTTGAVIGPRLVIPPPTPAAAPAGA